MDINTNSYSSTSSTLTTANTANKSETTKTTKSASNSTDSSVVKTDSYESSKSRTVTGLYTKPNKKLTDDQIQALKDAQAESNKKFMEALSSSLTLGQSSNALTASSLFDSTIFTSQFCQYTCEIPALATDPKEAQAAISEGGAYSVDAVATRIMDLATALAGDDQEMLSKMRSAVEKGFSMAGATFSQVTGKKNLPQICQDTYKEVMSRFDKLQNKTADSNTTNNSSSKIDESNTEESK